MTNELNQNAIRLGEQERDVWQDDLVDLDVEVAVGEHQQDELDKKARELNEKVRAVWQQRKIKADMLRELESLLRELKRPREGFPELSDEMYESRMLDLRGRVQYYVGS